MGTPFKMNGFGGFGNSPIKQTYVDIGGKEVYASGSGSGVSISGTPSKKPLSTFTLKPGVSVGKFNLAGKYKGGFKTDETGKSTQKTFTGGGATFSAGHWRGGFKGSLSGDYGTTKHPTGDKTTGYSGRASLGFGKTGSSTFEACPGGGCGTEKIGYNIQAFGEHGSKGSFNPGTRVGISGRYGVLSGEGSYDINTKQLSGKLGITIPINK